ncbi:MAG: Uma2 family endonuclease [Acidobacteria bacterium]|nr:Uma2 family endonuclease [Acidobacteriota bacterium]
MRPTSAPYTCTLDPRLRRWHRRPSTLLGTTLSQSKGRRRTERTHDHETVLVRHRGNHSPTRARLRRRTRAGGAVLVPSAARVARRTQVVRPRGSARPWTGRRGGAPDMVVEVLSPGTERHDRTEKLGWYRQYGVRECWLIDAGQERVTVVDFTGAMPVQRIARGAEFIQSSVLPDLTVMAFTLFS